MSANLTRIKIIKNEEAKTARMSVTFSVEWANNDGEAAAEAGNLFGELLARVITDQDELDRLMAAFEAERLAVFGV
jgi:hypothetical protein